MESCVVTFSPGALQLSLAQALSHLDILDNVLQLLFGVHVEGLPGLYCCQLQDTQNKDAIMKLWDLISSICKFRIMWLNILCPAKVNREQCTFSTDAGWDVFIDK